MTRREKYFSTLFFFIAHFLSLLLSLACFSLPFTPTSVDIQPSVCHVHWSNCSGRPTPRTLFFRNLSCIPVLVSGLLVYTVVNLLHVFTTSQDCCVLNTYSKKALPKRLRFFASMACDQWRCEPLL